eukprot:CAMPEP_0183756010 /NCGR_PEP_ID=MMETSP0739-20130205/4697_1 /TAXON_ID=385413 /ORGANISM="Thalassiosira miniscula, Strain CCMP1093" /LENGTH=464 /DNA_ID=CAMNT_0025993065 /DNA_START=135 /DNA_END=1529 /DNA_ORIENTATION=+
MEKSFLLPIAALCAIFVVCYLRSIGESDEDMAPKDRKSASDQTLRFLRVKAWGAFKDFETNIIKLDTEITGTMGKLEVEDWSDSDQNERKTKKPTAVIHIGPPKTGSSSLQYSLRSVAAITAMNNDEYSMPWQIKAANDGMHHDSSEYEFLSCFLSKKRMAKMERGRANPLCPEGELSFVHQLGKEGKNIFLSGEGFSSVAMDITSLAAYLECYWDTTIVYFHRWFHDLVFSHYGQYAKGFEKKSFEDFMAARGSGNVYYYSMLKHFERMYKSDFNEGSYASIYNYREHFDNVVALDFNDKSSSLQEKVFCDAMPNAEHTCEYFSDHKQEIQNQAQPLVYNNIAYGANMLALTTYCSRDHFDDVIEKIKDYQEVTLGLTYSDFPIRCVDNATLKRLIDLSIEHRRKILIDKPLTKAAEENIRTEYWEKMKKASCEADINAILEKPEWLQFFDALGNDTNCNKVI